VTFAPPPKSSTVGAIDVNRCAAYPALLFAVLLSLDSVPPWSADQAHAADGAAPSEGFPTAAGNYVMTEDWSISLPGAFKRRFEDGSLVLWRQDVTVWIMVWNKPAKETKTTRLALLRKDVSRDAFDVQREESNGVLRFSYRLRESWGDAKAPAFYSFVVGECGHVQMAVYFDDERDVEVARTLWRGLKEVRRPTGRCSGNGPHLLSEPRR
jgi:hypothetical protein